MVATFLSVVPAAAAAQTAAENAAKYAALRERLVTDWLVLGTESGMSMPAHIRHEPQAYIRWADATIDLGWYIGILGTELALRQDPRFAMLNAELSARDTADELSLALLALERLDLVADASFAPECPGEPELNGFFIRDDVPADFHTNFAGMTSTRSDFVDPTVTNKEMSQDQVYHLLLGLALVRGYVQPGVIVRGRDLREHAIELAERIIRKMEADQWLIQNPVCDRDVDRGHSATAYSPGTARAAAWFTDGAYFPETSQVAQGIWELAKDKTAAFFQDPDNLHMAMALGAVGRGWDDETLPVLADLSTVHRWSVYPLAYRALHEDPTWCDFRDALVADARAQLDELPAGQFPGSPRPDVAVHGFTVSNRYIRGSEQHYIGPEGSEGEDNHGLDYMLLHNVTALAAPELWLDAAAECETTGTDDVGGVSMDAGRLGEDAGSTKDAGMTDTAGSSTDAAYPPDAGPPRTDAGCCRTTGGRRRLLPLVFFILLISLKPRTRTKNQEPSTRNPVPSRRRDTSGPRRCPPVEGS